MKTEKMIMARFGLKYGEASKIVKQARTTLGISSSCAWTEELEEEAFRMCGGESDSNKKQLSQDSASTATTSASTSAVTPAAPPASPTINYNRSGTVATQKKTKSVPPQHQNSSENIGCWTPGGSQKGKITTGNKLVADLQHDTLLEGAEVKKEAPKLPVRRHSNMNLEGSEHDASGSVDRSDSYSDDDDEANMPLPIIRPLRRTDSRTKHA